MSKSDAWGNAFYLFLVGFVVFFWAASPTLLGLWIGICLTYGFSQAKEAPKTVSLKKLRAEREIVKEDKLKEFVNDVTYYKPNGKKVVCEGIPIYYPDIRTKSGRYDLKEANNMNHMRKVYVRNKFQNDLEFAKRFLSVGNLTSEELHDLKENFLIPNRFTEEEMKYALYPFWRDDKNFLMGRVMTGEGAKIPNKSYPKKCYDPITGKPIEIRVVLNEAFKKVNGHDLFD